MKKYPLYLFSLTLLLAFSKGNAQAPNISYSPSTYVLTKNVAITPITPTNTGGAVPATVYGAVTTLVSSGLDSPRGLAVDGAGNIYEADFDGNVIYQINSSTGAKTIIAGSGTAGESDNTTGTSAMFQNPSGIVYDGSGYLYVTDFGGNTIRKISTTAPYAVTTIAGTASTAGELDATGTSALFNQPAGIAYDGSTYLYVTDFGGSTIRRINIATGAVLTIAGTANTASETDGNGTSATFNGPSGIAFDSASYLYVVDNMGNSIRKVDTSSTHAVTTFVNSSAGLSSPWGIAIDASHNFEVADAGNNLVRTITPTGIVLTLAGDGTTSEVDADGVLASLNNPYALVIDNTGTLFVGDNITTSSTIRKIALTGYAIVPVLNSNLTFDTSTGTISGTPTISFSPIMYTVTAFNASGSSSVIVTLSCGGVIDWTGAVNGDWGNAGNWTGGATPTATDDVQIGVSSFTNQPIIDVPMPNNITIKSLTFGSVNPVTLTINNPHTLTIKNNLTVSSNLTDSIAGTGLIKMIPNSVVNVSGTSVLALNLTSGGLFTLQSDSTGDASVNQITATSITGSVNVERYLRGGNIVYRGYRLLSSPVYHATDGYGNAIYNINYLKNSIYLTSTSTTGGFDNTQAANPTLYLYRENMTPNNSSFTGGNFRGIKDITSAPDYTIDIDGGPYNIPVGNGYLCFNRGNRAATSFSAETKSTYVPQTVTLSTNGTLNAGQITIRDWFTPSSSSLSYTSSSPSNVKGFNLVGNPYACAIDWDSFQSSSTTSGIYGNNISSTMYTLDPVTKTYGSYIAGSSGIGSSSSVSNIISSGQGFFVVTNGSGASLIFNESAKTPTNNTGAKLLMGKPITRTAINSYLRLQLMGKDSTICDQTLIRFNNQASLIYDTNVDAEYKPGFGTVSLSSLSSDMIKLCINTIPMPKQQNERIKLNITANKTGNYTLSLRNIVAIPQLYDIWIVDNYKKDSVDLRASKTYSLDINNTDTTSFGSNRLTLVIRQNQAYAYQLLNFEANKSSTIRQVAITWNTKNEGNYTNFTVERSIDNGKTFNVLGSVTASDLGKYSFIDTKPINGTNSYRLKQEDINNVITYSNIVPIEYSDLSNSITVNALSLYPNPTTNAINISINAPSAKETNYTIKIMNSSGITVKQVTCSQTTWQGSISTLSTGTYIIRVLNSKNDTLIGENKFVKL